MAQYMTANINLNYTNIGYVGSTGISYNEKITGPLVSSVYQDISLTVSGGSPQTDFYWEAGDTSGTGVLDSNGSATVVVNHAEPRVYIYKFRFAGTGNILEYKISATTVPWLVTLQDHGAAPVAVNEGDVLTLCFSLRVQALEAAGRQEINY